MGGFFRFHTGHPAVLLGLMAGLLYPQQAFQLSDEALVAR